MEHAYITPLFKPFNGSLFSLWVKFELQNMALYDPVCLPLLAHLLLLSYPLTLHTSSFASICRSPGHFWFSIPNGQIYSQFRNGDYFSSQEFFGCRLSVLGLRNMEMCRKQSLFLEKERGAYWEAGTERIEAGGVNKSGCVWAGINRLVQLEHRVGAWEGQKVKPKK